MTTKDVERWGYEVLLAACDAVNKPRRRASSKNRSPETKVSNYLSARNLLII
jgi:hypothetical protein